MGDLNMRRVILNLGLKQLCHGETLFTITNLAATKDGQKFAERTR